MKQSEKQSEKSVVNQNVELVVLKYIAEFKATKIKKAINNKLIICKQSEKQRDKQCSAVVQEAFLY